MIRMHYLQHVPFEGIGYIGSWARPRQFPLTATRFFKGDPLPGIADFDWLVILGGPMGVHDVSVHPWLKSEKQFIKESIGSGKTVIGICLGAQLVAEALGSKVYPGRKKEIGWYPVYLGQGAVKSRLGSTLPESMTVLHWHGETFDIPAGADHLMQTGICRNQAFVYDDRVLGLQFHLEMTPDSLRTMIDHCRHELIPDTYVQSEQEILKNVSLCEVSNQMLDHLFDHFLTQ